MNLSDVTMRQMEASRSTVLEGIILDSLEEIDDIITIIPCFCVHDSEHSPCKCMYNRKIYLERKDLLNDVEQLERESQDGERISRVTIDRNAEVLVEHSTAVSAEEAERLAEYADIIPQWPTDTLPFPTTTWPFPFPSPFPDREFPPFDGEEYIANLGPLVWPAIWPMIVKMVEEMTLPDGESPTPDGEENVVYFWPVALPIISAVVGAIAGAATKHALDKNCTTTETKTTSYDERGRQVIEERKVTVCE